MLQTYDVVIVGGGIVGLTLAGFLAKQTTLSIAVLESQKNPPSWSLDTYHSRVSAITLASKKIFQELGVWQALVEKRVSPFHKMHVWDVNEKHLHFDSKTIAESQLGYIIENNLLHTFLYEKLASYPQVTILHDVQLEECNVNTTFVELKNKHTIFKASLAIAADGANSWLRQANNISIDRHDYQQAAIVAEVQTSLPHNKTARQVFLEAGPLAFLPLSDAYTSSIVWSLATESANQLLQLTEEDFKNRLAKEFFYELGDIKKISTRYTFPLYKQQTMNYVSSRIALVGDAAHTIHPLAGQGVNMGLLDAASLAEVIQDAIKAKRDFSSLATLRRYERWRKADNLGLYAGVDLLNKLFTTDKVYIKKLRSLGLAMTDNVEWLKNIFTRHAVGNRLSLPRFMNES